MYDLIIRNGRIIDGTGADAFCGDLAVNGEYIVKIGDLSGEEALQVVDAKGEYVVPGFIDPHSHADMSILFAKTMEGYLQQGVTTVVGGNCGHSLAPMGDEVYRAAIVDMRAMYAANPSYFRSIQLLQPKAPAVKALKEVFGVDADWRYFGEYIDRCNAEGMDANIAPLVGYSAIRATVMGMDCCREATEEELDKIMELTRRSLDEGAFGVSTGMDPQYLPGPYATHEETVRMLKIVKEYDRMFASHTRSFNREGRPDRHYGYREMLEAAMEAGVRCNVSHMYSAVPDPEGAMADSQKQLDYIEEMEAKGLDVTFDVIPSPRSGNGTFPYASFYMRPFVLMAGSRRQLAKNYTVPDFRELVRFIVTSGRYPMMDPSRPNCNLCRMVVRRHSNPAYINKSLAQISAQAGQGKDVLDTMMDIFAEDCDMGVTVEHSGNGDEATRLMAMHRLAMPCADGMAGTKDTNYGVNDDLKFLPSSMNFCYTVKYLTEMGRGRLEDTIRQMTGYPAERFQISKRGFIKEGYHADVVIFDRDKLRTNERYDGSPLEYPDGISHVFVNGALTIHNKAHTGARSGHMLRFHDC